MTDYVCRFCRKKSNSLETVKNHLLEDHEPGSSVKAPDIKSPRGSRDKAKAAPAIGAVVRPPPRQQTEYEDQDL